MCLKSKVAGRRGGLSADSAGVGAAAGIGAKVYHHMGGQKALLNS